MNRTHWFRIGGRSSLPGAIRSLLVLVVVLPAVGCGSFTPNTSATDSFLARAETQSDQDVTVRVSVLDGEESRAYFGRPLEKHLIQPVWVEVSNGSSSGLYFSPLMLDPEYFAPREVAWHTHINFKGKTNQKIDRFFEDQAMPLHIPPGQSRSGFVYTNLDRGIKFVTVALIPEEAGEVIDLEYLLQVPGLNTDYASVDFESLYPPEDFRELGSLESLRHALESMPRTTKGGDKQTPGDPLNIVVIGNQRSIWPAFAGRGWHPTETVTTGSSLKTAWSSVVGSKYRYSPMSPLYVFDRKQDIGLQKARGTVDERTHLRLWLTPYTYNGDHVWIGQISRDIGVRLTWKTIVTHKIDPNVDETRAYLFQDLLASQGLGAVGFVNGVGYLPREEPGHNFTGDPYFTDGLRAVFFMSDEPVSLAEIDVLDWEYPRRVRDAHPTVGSAP